MPSAGRVPLREGHSERGVQSLFAGGSRPIIGHVMPIAPGDKARMAMKEVKGGSRDAGIEELAAVFATKLGVVSSGRAGRGKRCRPMAANRDGDDSTTNRP